MNPLLNPAWALQTGTSYLSGLKLEIYELHGDTHNVYFQLHNFILDLYKSSFA